MNINNTNYYKSTAENDYVSLLENFMNTLYASHDYNCGFFGLSAKEAEDRAEADMMYLGFTEADVIKAEAIAKRKSISEHQAIKIVLHQFTSRMLKQQKKQKEDYPFAYRFVLTLILGYLNRLDSISIIDCRNPEAYFEEKVADVLVPDLTRAIDKTRDYIRASNTLLLSTGMCYFETWLERLRNKKTPPKELTIADIEKKLGYKIKIVEEDKQAYD